MAETWTLKNHTGNGEWPDNDLIEGHDFTIYRKGKPVAIEPDDTRSNITWRNIRDAITLLNRLNNAG